jgi:predicted esterase
MMQRMRFTQAFFTPHFIPRLISLAFVLSALSACSWFGGGTKNTTSITQQLTLFNAERKRDVPLAITSASDAAKRCTKASLCRVVIFSHGYGSKHSDYSYLSQALAAQGLLFVSVQHELPGDPPLAMEGDIAKLRTPVWQRGAETILFVRESLKSRFDMYDWRHPIVMGHSNGGDISIYLANSLPQELGAVVTLDHRRVPIPRRALPRVLTLRSSDVPADEGVLPTVTEQQSLNIEVVQLADARHEDMSDKGPAPLKAFIVAHITRFLDNISMR